MSSKDKEVIIEIATTNTGFLDEVITTYSNEPYKARKVDYSLKYLKNCKLSDQEYQKLDKNTRDRIINSENDELIRKILNHCVRKCIGENKLGFMSVVADLLPELTESYNDLVINLIKQLTYVKVPLEWCDKNKVDSTNEILWGYRFPDPKPSSSIFDRFEKAPRHSITLCYVPLPGLCTYEKSKTSNFIDALFPHDMSPFVRLCFSVSAETYEDTQASSKIFESPPFQAIVKYKWHAFARYRFIAWFTSYLIQFAAFSAATNNTIGSKQLMTLSMLIGSLSFIFFFIRHFIINMLNGTGMRFFIAPTNIILFFVSVLPIFVGFLEFDSNSTRSVIRFPTIIIFWGGVVGFLCALSRSMGIFIIVVIQICRKILWLLIFLGLILIVCAHGTIVLFDTIKDSVQISNEEQFAKFNQNFKFLWFGFMGDYSFLSPWPNNFWLDIGRITFSFFTSIVILNIMIALVNNVYDEVLQRAYTEWTIIRAQAIANIELYMMLPSERQNRDYCPWTIIYEASTEEVEKWPQKLEAGKIPTPWNDPKQDDNDLQSLLDYIIC